MKFASEHLWVIPILVIGLVVGCCFAAFFYRRYRHYRKMRSLADAIAFAVQNGAHPMALNMVEVQSSVVFSVPREIVSATREGNWITILFTHPVQRKSLELAILTQYVRTFLPTWANFKLLTTDTDPDQPRALSPAELRRQERIAKFTNIDLPK
jgi:hypothetical protein